MKAEKQEWQEIKGDTGTETTLGVPTAPSQAIPPVKTWRCQAAYQKGRTAASPTAEGDGMSISTTVYQSLRQAVPDLQQLISQGSQVRVQWTGGHWQIRYTR